MKSGLRFVCHIAGVPEDTFAVGEFSLYRKDYLNFLPCT